MISRFPENPLIRPQAVKPSSGDMEVMCAFNPGAALYQGKVHLLVRVAERPIPEDGYVSTAVLDPEKPGELQVIRVKLEDPELEFEDPRLFTWKGELYLTSISHLRLAVSDDGRNFTVDPEPTILPEGPFETFGIEDARIARIDDAFYINYSAISPRGVTTCLARTRDFKSFERLGVIFAPDNKDVAIFPEKVGDRYYCLHRPSMKQIGSPSIWLASSENLLDWGRHRFIAGIRPGMWDGERVGGGALPVKTPEGWLEIYHGADENIRYCSGGLLLDLDQPWRVIARSSQPILAPEMDYEVEGLMPNVVFNNGVLQRPDGTVELYYGATDETCCGCTMDVQAVVDSLDRV